MRINIEIIKNKIQDVQDGGDSKDSGSFFDPNRWGLPVEAVSDLGNRLYGFWERFRSCFRTKTRDTSHYGV